MRNIKTMFRWGEEHGLCDYSVRLFPKVSHKPPITRKFTKEELTRLLKVVRPDFADLIRFAVLTGLRPIELRTLRRCNLEDSTVFRRFALSTTRPPKAPSLTPRGLSRFHP